METGTSLSRRAMLALLLWHVAGMPQAHADSPMDEGLALHLLNRLSYGPTPGEVARMRTMGIPAWIESQLAPPPMPPQLEARLRELAHPGTPPGEASLLRAIASPRQLEAVLADFPHDGRSPRALAAHFVSAPSAKLVRALARVHGEAGDEQAAVLRALFTSREFLAPAEWNSKRKDAFRFVVSALRASGLVVENVAPLVEFIRRPMQDAERADFIERLAGGRLSLALAPPQAQRHASSSPPMRAGVDGRPPQGNVAQPGPVLMEAPTPSAFAMARAARSAPADPERLRVLLRSEEFLRY